MSYDSILYGLERPEVRLRGHRGGVRSAPKNRGASAGEDLSIVLLLLVVIITTVIITTVADSSIISIITMALVLLVIIISIDY